MLEGWDCCEAEREKEQSSMFLTGSVKQGHLEPLDKKQRDITTIKSRQTLTQQSERDQVSFQMNRVSQGSS